MHPTRQKLQEGNENPWAVFCRQPCKPVVAVLTPVSRFIWNVRFLHKEAFVSPLHIHFFNMGGSAAFHAWCYLSSLLNPWDQNGLVWLGGHCREIWEPRSLPLALQGQAQCPQPNHFVTPCIPPPVTWVCDTPAMAHKVNYWALGDVAAAASWLFLPQQLLVLMADFAAGAGIQQTCVWKHELWLLSQA